MLILLPPSESKRQPPTSGPPIALDELSFPQLTDVRTRVLDALIETSARHDAFQRLFVGPSLAADVARNTRLREVPTMPALGVYSGPLYEGLAAATLSPAASARAERNLVIASALCGLLRPSDRIPPYRLNICSRLIGTDRLEPVWRAVVGDVLAEIAGTDGVILDLRSPSYQAMGMPTDLGDRTVTLRIEQPTSGGARIGNVFVKRIRGEAARHLLERAADPAEPADVADLLADRWPVRLDAPARPGHPWILSLIVAN